MPIIDRTGLSQHFSIDLQWEEQPGKAERNRVALKQALLEQLGLGLESASAPALGGDVEIAEAIKPLLPSNLKDYNQSLSAAARDGRREMTSWLIENGVTDPNVPDGFDKTALMFAVEKKYAKPEALLRQHRAVIFDRLPGTAKLGILLGIGGVSVIPRTQASKPNWCLKDLCPNVPAPTWH